MGKERKTRGKGEGNKSSDYYYEEDYVDSEKPSKYIKLSTSANAIPSPKKREHRHTQHDKSEEISNLHKQKKSRQPLPPANHEEDEKRKRIRNLFSNLFRGSCEESKAELVAKEIEEELFKLYNTSTNYASSARALLSSLRLSSNQSLREKILAGGLSAQKLCSMDARDLADDELIESRKRAAEESLKSRMISSSNEPIYRKTHKGEELVSHEEELEQKLATAASESPPSSPYPFLSSQKSLSLPLSMHSSVDHHLKVDPDEDEESDEDILIDDEDDDENGDVDSKPLSSSSSSRLKSEIESFDKHKDQKTDGETEKKEIINENDEILRNTTKTTIISSISSNGRVRPPKLDLNQFNQIVWEGSIMKSANIQRFNIKASIVYGPDISQLLHNEISGFNIIGRIDVKRLPKYFDDLDKSNTHKRTVLYLSPMTSADDYGYTAMYQYFIDKQRAAVLEMKPNQHPRVREVYIVPLSSDTSPPDYLIKSSSSSSSSSSSFDFLSDSKDKLICIVVYKRKSSHAIKPRELLLDDISHPPPSVNNFSSPPHYNPASSPPFANTTPPMNSSFSPPSSSPTRPSFNPSVDLPLNSSLMNSSLNPSSNLPNLSNPPLPPSLQPSSIMDIINQLIKPSSNPPVNPINPLQNNLQNNFHSLHTPNNLQQNLQNNGGNVNDFLNNNNVNMMMNNFSNFQNTIANNLAMGLSGIPGLSNFPGLNLANLSQQLPPHPNFSQPPAHLYQTQPPPLNNPPLSRGPANTNYNPPHNVSHNPFNHNQNNHYNNHNNPRSHPSYNAPHNSHNSHNQSYSGPHSPNPSHKRNNNNNNNWHHGNDQDREKNRR